MKKQTKNEDIIDAYDYLTNAASTQDCTGLIPSLPYNDAELESYENIYQYQPPRLKVKNPSAKQPPK